MMIWYYMWVMALKMNHTLQWRHNGRDNVSNHQHHDCLLNRLFRRRSKKTSKLHITGLCAGNSPGTGEFPAQIASNAENVSIWWGHPDKFDFSDNTTNVAPIRNLIWFPIGIFYYHLTLFLDIDAAVKFHKEMLISSFSLQQTVLYIGFMSKPELS